MRDGSLRLGGISGKQLGEWRYVSGGITKMLLVFEGDWKQAKVLGISIRQAPLFQAVMRAPSIIPGISCLSRYLNSVKVGNNQVHLILSAPPLLHPQIILPYAANQANPARHRAIQTRAFVTNSSQSTPSTTPRQLQTSTCPHPGFPRPTRLWPSLFSR